MRRIPLAKPETLGNLSELKFAPFTDLAFVLLIIFVLLAPFLINQPDLTAATETSTEVAVAGPSQVYVLSLDEVGRMSIAGSQLDEDGLRDQLKSFVQSDPNIGIVIRADKRLRVEDLVKVMDAVKAAGITNLGVMTK